MRAGEVRRLYVFRLDRLARSGIRDTLGLLEEFRGAGCELVTLADGFSLDGPARDVIVAVIAWAAQMERAAIGERISAARERIERAGGKWGRPGRMTQAQAEKALVLKGKGKSIRSIAVAVKVPRSTVADFLSGKGTGASVSRARQKPGVKKIDPRPSE